MKFFLMWNKDIGSLICFKFPNVSFYIEISIASNENGMSIKTI